jgi:hypothetical protein
MPPIQLSSGINFPFENVEVAQALSILPNKYGRITRSGLFGTGKGLLSTIAEVRIREGQLVILGSKERGSEYDSIERTDEDAIYFPIPHFPWKGSLTPADIQGLFAFEEGPHNPKQAAEAMNELLIDMREPADASTEYMRVGALKGLVKDGNGKTIVDLYDAFNITKKIVYFDLDNENTNVIAKCAEVTSHVEDKIGGQELTGVVCETDSVFMEKILMHASVTAYLQSGPALAVEALRQARLDMEEKGFVREFHINGVTFRTYRGKATLRNGTVDPFIAEGKGHAYPTGTRNVFRTFYAPAHAMSAANKIGQRIWTSMKPLDHDQGVEVAMQMNELNICSMPQVLVECDDGADPG